MKDFTMIVICLCLKKLLHATKCVMFISVQNPCLELSNLNCSHYCVIDDKTAKCQCEHGFVLANDSQTCIGMDDSVM